MNQQAQIFDIHVLRAIGCLMVVLVHVSALYYVQRGSWEDVILFINQASRFGTPVFAVVSGLLLFLQVKKRGFFFKKFFSSRLNKIVIPFLLWTAFYLVYIWLVFGANPFDGGMNRFIFKVAFGETYSHLYFISIVLQFYLIFPLLQFIKGKGAWVGLLVLSALLHIFSMRYMVSGQFEGLFGLIAEQRAFLPKWLFFFIFGGFLAYHWDIAKKWAYKMRVLLFIAVLLIFYMAAVEYEWGGYIGSNRITNIINLPIIVLFMMAITEKIARNPLLHSVTSRLGAMSMGIYLIHPFVINMLQRNLPTEVWTLSLFPIWFAVVMFITIGIILMIQKLPFGHVILTVPAVGKKTIVSDSKNEVLKRRVV
ncbi:acyltransferase [Jeotgalibacillus sp. S-D1]|uniref:acyltransferase n=1 Tax=Jeotgalibacillus sp. S-D1 TaxID=2552189 RepID=UPI001059EF80|nr:acyltransferase [Jeotgalibacillus sp. S-D1]TDL34840.1 acyltransferase [Jeotgalibacillus sp. S-D1]